MDSGQLRWLLPLVALAIVAALAVVVQGYVKENATMNDTDNTMALEVSVPPIDATVPKIFETATFAMG